MNGSGGRGLGLHIEYMRKRLFFNSLAEKERFVRYRNRDTGSAIDQKDK